MNIFEESDAECFTLLDNLLPYLMMISFVVGFLILKLLKGNNSQFENNNSKKILKENQEKFFNSKSK